MKLKEILFNLVLIIIAFFTFYILEIELPEDIMSKMTNLSIIVALFTLITTYLVRYQEVKINILTTLILGLLFIIVIAISFLISTEIITVNLLLYKVLVIMTTLYITYIMIVFSSFYYNKFLYKEFALFSLQQNKLIRKFKKTRSGENLNKSLDFLCEWVDKNYKLKNTISMTIYFDLLEEILIESIKNNVINKLNGDSEEFKWKEILQKSFLTSIKQKRQDILRYYLSSLQKIIDSAVKIENWTLVKEFNEFLYRDIYEYCLQNSKDFSEVIVLHYTEVIKNENVKKLEHKTVLATTTEIILTQMQKYDYNVSEFSIDLLYQEILQNYKILFDVRGVDYTVSIIYLAFKICKEVHKGRIMFFEFHKLDLFVKSFDSIEKRFEVIKIIVHRFSNSNDSTFSEFINVVYFDLFLSFPEAYYDIFVNQIEAMNFQEISGSEIKIELVFEFIKNYSNDNKDKIQVLSKFSFLFEKIESSFVSFFTKLISFIKKKTISDKELTNILSFISEFTKISFNQTKSLFHESLIIGLRRFYLFILEKYSGDTYKEYREKIYDNYMDLIELIYNYSRVIENRKIIVDLLMDFQNAERESERKKAINVALQLGYKSLEEANFEVSEKVSNILGWSLFNILRKIFKGNPINPDFTLVSDINCFFENVVKYSNRKTSIFVGTIYVVNYVFCDLYYQRNKSIKKYLDRITNYLKSNASFEALRVIEDSVTLRSNFIYSYYEDDKHLDRDTIKNSCSRLKNQISTYISEKKTA